MHVDFQCGIITYQISSTQAIKIMHFLRNWRVLICIYSGFQQENSNSLRVYAMKMMHLGSKSELIIHVQIECTLNAISFKCVFSQSILMSDFKLVWRWIISLCEIICVVYICVSLKALWTNNKGRNNKHNLIPLLRYNVCCFYLSLAGVLPYRTGGHCLPRLQHMSP